MVPKERGAPAAAADVRARPLLSARATAVMMAALVCAIVVAADLGLPLPMRRILALPLLDKLGHFMLLGALSWLVLRALMEALPDRSRAQLASASSLALMVVAAIEEFSQNYIEARTFSWWDLVASWLGITGMAALRLWQSARAGRAPSRAATGKRA